MLVVLVHVTVKAEELAAFERAILENAAQSVATEPGCARFDVNRSETDPTQWMFYEMYADADAYAAHRATAHYAAWAKVAERVLTARTVTRYESRSLPRESDRVR